MRQIPSSILRIAAIFVIALHALAIGLALPSEPLDDGPDVSFREGKKLLENNCGQCVNATREGLELGIKKIQRAIHLGFEDTRAAYQLLAQAYGDIAFVYAQSDSSEQREALKIQESCYRYLHRLNPDNTEVLYELISFAEDDEERVALLRRVIELDPTHLFARFRLGQLLVTHGEIDEGLEMMRAALDQELQRGDDVRRIRFFGTRLEWELRSQGLEQEADDVARQHAARTGRN